MKNDGEKEMDEFYTCFPSFFYNYLDIFRLSKNSIFLCFTEQKLNFKLNLKIYTTNKLLNGNKITFF